MLVTDNVVGSPQQVFLQGTATQGTAAASTTTVASSLNPSVSGQSVILTATVTGPVGDATVPTGTVTFYDAATMLTSSGLNPSGEAMLTTSALSVGSHSITASYGGDSNFSASTSPVLTQVVNTSSKASSTTAVVSSPNPSASGQSVMFTATVTGPSGNTTVPTGSVNFMDGTTTLGSGTLNGSGVASYSTSSLSVASHSITAVYAGNSNFNGSTSAVLTQVVNAAGKATGEASRRSFVRGPFQFLPRM